MNQLLVQQSRCHQRYAIVSRGIADTRMNVEDAKNKAGLHQFMPIESKEGTKLPRVGDSPSHPPVVFILV